MRRTQTGSTMTLDPTMGYTPVGARSTRPWMLTATLIFLKGTMKWPLSATTTTATLRIRLAWLMAHIAFSAKMEYGLVCKIQSLVAAHCIVLLPHHITITSHHLYIYLHFTHTHDHAAFRYDSN